MEDLDMKRSYTQFVDLMQYYRNFVYNSAMDKVEDIKVLVDVEHTVYYESFDGEAIVKEECLINIGIIPDGNYTKIITTAVNKLGEKHNTATTLHIKSVYRPVKRFDLYTRF
jgi:hypothetical protein